MTKPEPEWPHADPLKAMLLAMKDAAEAAGGSIEEFLTTLKERYAGTDDDDKS